MKKRSLSMILVVFIFISCLQGFTLHVGAVTTSTYEPHTNIQYEYTTSVTCGTIRYMSQIPGKTYFDWRYWPANSFGGYASPNTECYTASISMALSYIGVNKTPYDLLYYGDYRDGYTGYAVTNEYAAQWGGSVTRIYSADGLDDIVLRYINGKGKYSPVIIHLDIGESYSGAEDPGHFVAIVGRVSSGVYQILDPVDSALFTLTISDGKTTYKGVANSILDYTQYYNPNAELPGYLAKCTEYASYCKIYTTDKTSAMTLPCSNATNSESTVVEALEKHTEYIATALFLNDQGNYWYRIITSDGGTAYVPSSKAGLVIDMYAQDLQISGAVAPSALTEGDGFPIEGVITTQYSEIYEVTAYVYKEGTSSVNSVLSSSATVNGKYYSLKGSAVDKALTFGTLEPGTYIYLLEVYCIGYYAPTEKTREEHPGTIQILYRKTFTVAAAEETCNHSYSSTVTTEATCTSSGVRTYSCSACGDTYTESVTATGHSYGNWLTTVTATCAAEGRQKSTCSVCGEMKFQSIPATGDHVYGNWAPYDVYATCTEEGTEARRCTVCDDVQVRVAAPTGHTYTSTIENATCTVPERLIHTCVLCGYTYEEYVGMEYSEWSAEKPTNVDDRLIQEQTQYRYSDYTSVTSSALSLNGYTQTGSGWKETEKGSIYYVSSWPSGFDTNHSLYTTYNKVNFLMKDTETETSKTVINSNVYAGYIYYHWCRGTYTAGPMDRRVNSEKAGEFVSFHSFYSTTDPSTLTADTDNSYIYANADCCTDSHWYFAFPVYVQNYTTYQKVYTYSKWTDWSEWSDTVYTTSDTRNVETRTVYRYITAGLADHIWNSVEVITPSTCIQDGVQVFTCGTCGWKEEKVMSAQGHSYVDGVCTLCSAVDPDAVVADITVGAATANPGATIVLPLQIFNNPGTANLTVVLDYDTSALTLTDVTEGEVLAASSGGILTTNLEQNKITWEDSSNVEGNGNILYLTFKVSDTAVVKTHVIRCRLNATQFINEDDEVVRVRCIGGSVTVLNPVNDNTPTIVIKSMTARPGEQIAVTVSLKNNPGIASAKLKLDYSAILTLTQIEYNTAIGGQFQQPQTMTSPVTLNWINGTANSTGDWVFATLTFTVSENAVEGDTANITVTYDPEDLYNITEENILFVKENGLIVVEEYMPGDINGDGSLNNKDLTRLFQYLSDWDVEVVEKAMDVNGDGKINNKDLTRLFQYLSDWDVEIC